MAALPQNAHQPNPFLSPKQQDLLLAALNTQAQPKQPSLTPAAATAADIHPRDTMSTLNESALFTSPQDADLDQFGLDYTPELDYLDGDTSFDFDNADLGGEMIGALPGEHHEKRKSRDEGSPEESSAKRQETLDGEKGAKKPGRKPLTSEPTTKRKAQNRAAQRAFRERKEKHLKDLETQVAELTKSQEADKHENGILKAQVERLTVELREYRKRLSQTAGTSRSPPVSTASSHHRPKSGAGNLMFDFPQFGLSAGSQDASSISAPNTTRASTARSTSGTPPTGPSPASSTAYQFTREASTGSIKSPPNPPTSHTPRSASQSADTARSFAPYSTDTNMHGFANTLPQMNGGEDPFGGLFSPSILKSANNDGYFNNTNSAGSASRANPGYGADNGDDSTSGVPGAFVFNSNSSTSDGTSPSASSSPWNAHGPTNSSCGTSPEPANDNLNSKDSKSNAYAQYSDNPQQPLQNTFSNPQSAINFGTTNFDASNLGTFDPLLFGDYRESNDAIVGAGDFTGGFFDDALNSVPFDYGSPSNLFGILQPPSEPVPKSQNTNVPTPAKAYNSTYSASTAVENEKPSAFFMAEVEKARDGPENDSASQKQPKSVPANYISCNNIWSQLQSNSDFQDGKFDLDGLCSELRTKARCSESGVLVDQNHVDAALRKLGTTKEMTDVKSGSSAARAKISGQPSWVGNPNHLMFEQSSWDNVLRKLSRNATVNPQKASSTSPSAF